MFLKFIHNLSWHSACKIYQYLTSNSFMVWAIVTNKILYNGLKSCRLSVKLAELTFNHHIFLINLWKKQNKTLFCFHLFIFTYLSHSWCLQTQQHTDKHIALLLQNTQLHSDMGYCCIQVFLLDGIEQSICIFFFKISYQSKIVWANKGLYYIGRHSHTLRTLRACCSHLNSGHSKYAKVARVRERRIGLIYFLNG